MNGETQQPDIVVTGWSGRYRNAVDKLLTREGGYVNDRTDRGGKTNYGISLRFLVSAGAADLDHDGYADFDLDMDGDIDGADIRLLTQENARDLYYRCFWKDLDCAAWPAPVGEMLFDQAVNGGAVAACKILQRAINACLFLPAGQSAPDRPLMLKDDGVLGTKTRGAFDWVLQRPGIGMAKLVVAYRDSAGDRYRAIVARRPSQMKFLKGWLNRTKELGK